MFFAIHVPRIRQGREKQNSETWSGIISEEVMLPRKFNALTFHVKARSIDKLIRIRPWESECIINIYRGLIAALQSNRMHPTLLSSEPFQFQLQFKRPSITPSWGRGEIPVRHVKAQIKFYLVEFLELHRAIFHATAKACKWTRVSDNEAT